jgi:transcriptional regulator with XRE-family HTH domain
MVAEGEALSKGSRARPAVIARRSSPRRANFHRTFVSQVERGMNNISIDNIGRLSAALGVDIVDLLKRSKD